MSDSRADPKRWLVTRIRPGGPELVIGCFDGPGHRAWKAATRWARRSGSASNTMVAPPPTPGELAHPQEWSPECRFVKVGVP